MTEHRVAPFVRADGRGDALQPMRDGWKAGNCKAATGLVPAELIDQLFISGSPGACRQQIHKYLDCGLDTSVSQVMTSDRNIREVTNALASAARR